jgi:hypothetical protein
MNRTPVSSSNLKSVGYDRSSNTLEIGFHGGRVYQYYNVPKEIYQGLMAASSHGTYHNRRIKGNFRYSRVQ